jgi:hypothetical protein
MPEAGHLEIRKSILYAGEEAAWLLRASTTDRWSSGMPGIHWIALGSVMTALRIPINGPKMLRGPTRARFVLASP